MVDSPFLKVTLLLAGIFVASFLGTFIVTASSAYLSSRNTSKDNTQTAPANQGSPCNCSQQVTSSTTTSKTSSGTDSGGAKNPVRTPFVYSFNAEGVLNETASARENSSPFWFPDSGGRLIIAEGVGSTIQGALPVGDRWRSAYARTSAADTDNGTHPQNLFRLVTKQSWVNTSTELSYFIDANNFSTSENRNESNGLLLMSRYQDHNTLYYAGIRVDGTAVIKKKYEGTYYTMAQTPIFPGTYDRASAPNLLPLDTWLRLRMDTQTNADGSVTITLFLKRGTETLWQKLLSVTDKGTTYGGTPPITSAGLLGVRTDFMDVSFSDFRVTPL